MHEPPRDEERPAHDDAPVTLRDAETARHIARSAATGGPAERHPTREQLLAAFDVPADSPDAVRRVENALRFAGVHVAPSLREGLPGTRVDLEVTAPDAVPRGQAVRRAALGVTALAVVIGGVALASTLGGEGERADVLPAADSTATAAATPAATPTPTPTPTPAPATGAAGVAATGASGTTGAEGPTAEELAAEERRQERAAAQRKRDAERRAAARRRVTVKLTPSAPTFLCVDDGNGKQLFNGTLSTPKTFKAKRIRLNVGLASTKVTVNGKPYVLTGSPAGVDITPKKRTPLPLGQRPCS